MPNRIKSHLDAWISYHTINAAAKGFWLKKILTGSNPGIARDAPARSSIIFLRWTASLFRVDDGNGVNWALFRLPEMFLSECTNAFCVVGLHWEEYACETTTWERRRGKKRMLVLVWKWSSRWEIYKLKLYWEMHQLVNSVMRSSFILFPSCLRFSSLQIYSRYLLMPKILKFFQVLALRPFYENAYVELSVRGNLNAPSLY